MSFVADVRQELGSVQSPDPVAEVGAILRLGGRWHRRHLGGEVRTTLELVTRSGAVARRVFGLLRDVGAPSPEIWVREPYGVEARTSYGVHVSDPATLRRLAVVDGAGRPSGLLPDEWLASPGLVLRAALLSIGSVSTPGRDVHLELAAPTSALANQLARLLVARVGPALVTDDERHRVVVKSGVVVGDVLELTGAAVAHARWQEQLLRRHLRAEANRMTNADNANLDRTVAAARRQVEDVERLVDHHGWRGFDDDLKHVALARVANPAASLAELGELCRPPLSRSAVHRRMARLAEAAALVAAEQAEAWDGGGTADILHPTEDRAGDV